MAAVASRRPMNRRRAARRGTRRARAARRRRRAAPARAARRTAAGAKRRAHAAMAALAAPGCGRRGSTSVVKRRRWAMCVAPTVADPDRRGTGRRLDLAGARSRQAAMASTACASTAATRPPARPSHRPPGGGFRSLTVWAASARCAPTAGRWTLRAQLTGPPSPPPTPTCTCWSRAHPARLRARASAGRGHLRRSPPMSDRSMETFFIRRFAVSRARRRARPHAAVARAEQPASSTAPPPQPPAPSASTRRGCSNCARCRRCARPAGGHRQSRPGARRAPTPRAARRIDVLAQEIETLKIGETVATASTRSRASGPPPRGLPPAARLCRRLWRGAHQGFDGKLDRHSSAATGEATLERAVVYVGYKFSDQWLFNSELSGRTGARTPSGSPTWTWRGRSGTSFGHLLMPMGFLSELHEPRSTSAPGGRSPSSSSFPAPGTRRAPASSATAPVHLAHYVVTGFDARGFSAESQRGAAGA